MILEIFSIYTQERVGMIKTFKFVQYISEFCGAGTFSIKVPISEESLKYLDKKHFILFDNDIMGLIRYRKKTTENSSDVEIKGYLLNKLLDWRSFLVTKTFKGTITEISRNMVDFFFIHNTDARRNIPLIKLATEPEYIPDGASTSMQVTGKTVRYALESVLNSSGYGYSIVPVIAKYSETLGQTTNISALSFRVHKPTDRTIGNTTGNNPVVFSTSMNNLSSSTYTEDDTEYCSTAIVAGEGEGTERTIVEVGNTEVSGIDRIELYVDARDLQSDIDENTSMTAEEYKEALTNRGNSHMEDHASFSSMEGTVIDGASSYVYGRDFFNGDYVSIIDEELGLVASVQITSVSKSLTESGEKLDMTFGKERVSIQKIVRKRGIV